MTEREGAKVTHNFKPWFAINEIDCREVREHVHRCAGIVTQKLVRVDPSRGAENDSFVAVLRVSGENVITEFADDEFEKILGHLFCAAVLVVDD
jgi:hypothetical protein